MEEKIDEGDFRGKRLDSAFVLTERERVMMGGGQGFGWSVVEGKGLTSDSSLHDGKATDIGGVAVFHFVLEVEGVVLFGFGIRNAVQDFGVCGSFIPAYISKPDESQGAADI